MFDTAKRPHHFFSSQQPQILWVHWVQSTYTQLFVGHMLLSSLTNLGEVSKHHPESPESKRQSAGRDDNCHSVVARNINYIYILYKDNVSNRLPLREVTKSNDRLETLSFVMEFILGTTTSRGFQPICHPDFRNSELPLVALCSKSICGKSFLEISFSSGQMPHKVKCVGTGWS